MKKYIILAASFLFASTLTLVSATVTFPLYVANGGDGTIEQFTSGGIGSLFTSTGLPIVEGIAFDISGNLYVADWAGGTIRKFTPGGVGSIFANTGLNNPTGLAFDSVGNLYVRWTPKFGPGAKL